MAKEHKYDLDVPQIPAGEPIMLFRAQDATLPALLSVYAFLCKQAGSPFSHTDHVDAIRVNVLDWQRKNTDKVKAPD